MASILTKMSATPPCQIYDANTDTDDINMAAQPHLTISPFTSIKAPQSLDPPCASSALVCVL